MRRQLAQVIISSQPEAGAIRPYLLAILAIIILPALIESGLARALFCVLF
ncbi:MAG: hypothetical protein GXP62_05080 [Oligoflexia bacterium]|nr:hypothetical protein [Oligoflexia bacterium]